MYIFSAERSIRNLNVGKSIDTVKILHYKQKLCIPKHTKVEVSIVGKEYK